MMLSFFTGISFTPPFLGETSSWDSTLEKKILCKRDGSGGRVFSGCPGCYLGSIRVCPYNRDVAIIFLSTEYAAIFSCSRVYCVWLSGASIRQRCVGDSNSLNPCTETIGTTRCSSHNQLCPLFTLKCSEFLSIAVRLYDHSD